LLRSRQQCAAPAALVRKLPGGVMPGYDGNDFWLDSWSLLAGMPEARHYTHTGYCEASSLGRTLFQGHSECWGNGFPVFRLPMPLK